MVGEREADKDLNLVTSASESFLDFLGGKRKRETSGAGNAWEKKGNIGRGKNGKIGKN